MSFNAMAWVWELPQDVEFSLAQHHVLLAIGDLTHDEQTAHVDLDPGTARLFHVTLAKRARCSVGCARKAVDVLITIMHNGRPVLEKIPYERIDGGIGANIYRLGHKPWPTRLDGSPWGDVDNVDNSGDPLPSQDRGVPSQDRGSATSEGEGLPPQDRGLPSQDRGHNKDKPLPVLCPGSSDSSSDQLLSQGHRRKSDVQNPSNPKDKDGGQEDDAPFEVVKPVDRVAEEIFLALFGGRYNAPYDPESDEPPSEAAVKAKSWEGTVYRATGLVNDGDLKIGFVLGAAGDMRQSHHRGRDKDVRCVGACFKGWLDKQVKAIAENAEAAGLREGALT